MESHKKVLLIYPGQAFFNSHGNNMAIKTSLLSLYSYLQVNGVKEVDILDMALEHKDMVVLEKDLSNFLKMCEKKLKGYAFDIVGISCFSTFNYSNSVLIARICRKINPNAVIVVGGWHCLARPKDFFFSPSLFDFVIQGEGEKSFLKIIKGEIASNGKETNVIRGEPFVQSDYVGFDYDFEGYKKHCSSLQNIGKIENVEFNLSRQCPFTCKFCDNHLAGYGGWNSFSVEKSLELIGKAVEAFDGLKSIVFDEAIFGMDRNWRREFLSGLSKLRYDISYMTQTRIDLLDEEDLALFGRLRNMFFCFGIESLSEKTLVAMNRSKKPAQYIREVQKNLSILKKSGTPVELNLILDHPGDSNDTQRETYSNLKEHLSDNIYVQTIEYYYFLPVFTDNYQFYRANYGAMVEGNPEWWLDKNPANAISSSRYVPSSEPNETFATAFERYRKWLHFWKTLYDSYKRKNPVDSIRR